MSDSASTHFNDLTLTPGLSAQHSMQNSQTPSETQGSDGSERNPKRMRFSSPETNGVEGVEHPLSISRFLAYHHRQEFLIHTITARTVQQPTMVPLPAHPIDVPNHPNAMLEYSPVSDDEGLHFIGWRAKVETWPTLDKGRAVQKSWSW